MMMRLIFVLLLFIAHPCFAFKTLLADTEYVYEMYESQDEIPLDVINEGLSMYFEAYLHPRLHEGLPLGILQIDESKFSSYEEFIADMFQRDFNSYRYPGETPRTYLQTRRIEDGKIVGVCAVLEQTSGGYYIDHIGVDKDFRRQKIAQTLIAQLMKNFAHFNAISLDTRVFNQPAQFLYEKLGFKKLLTHPLPSKQCIYFRYVFDKESPRLEDRELDAKCGALLFPPGKENN